MEGYCIVHYLLRAQPYNSPVIFTPSSEVTRGSFLDGLHKFEPQFMKNLSSQSLQATPTWRRLAHDDRVVTHQAFIHCESSIEMGFQLEKDGLRRKQA
ncbi:hypothetical protein AVEN_102658-1 [Araneus ventricosus]|uniref:Uncharacterized protein n=1 Tax=Araneus ventricosus TaxID=182803 RepID=A0A4Y2HYC2_ARAVE|nr:hypothetical protein AVEN_102658-1 [Araneus ventricosus]